MQDLGSLILLTPPTKVRIFFVRNLQSINGVKIERGGVDKMAPVQ
jgi:predicted RNA-binding protein with PUA domain